MGTITVDDGAVRALLEKGTSLLPVGVTACDGRFSAGDAVTVIGPDGTEVGKGIVEMSHDEVSKVLGMRSDAAREVLPGASAEIIHRDRLAVS
jgi:glutamate 5-kinase